LPNGIAQGDLAAWDFTMQTRLLAIAAIAALGTAADAADMAVKAPPPAPVLTPAADWTGIYLDGAIGWEHTHFDLALLNPAPPTLSPTSMSQNGGVVGGHIGYQQQFGWLVVGGEFGMAGTMTSSFASVTSQGGPFGTCGITAGTQCQARLNDVEMAGGKLGVDWQNWLVYGVGGWARGTVEARTISAATGGSFESTNGAPYNHGWYAGGGFDYLLLQGRPLSMIVGIEYEHVDLGTAAQLSSLDGYGPSPPGLSGRNISARKDIVWAKVTVKFNGWN
jgi:outer membrane immunogenic protein